MIEFTTGVALLVSSLYVVGNAPVKAGIVVADNKTEVGYATTTENRILNSKDVEKYLQEQYVDEPILVDIARCESTFRQFDAEGHIVRGKVNSEDVGVMQINEKYHAEKAVTMGLNIYTVEGNVAYAKYLYDNYGAQPWKSSSKCWSKPVVLASNQ